MRLYVPIAKIDAEQQMVWGYASTFVRIDGTINVEAAQNVSDATTLTVGQNSTFGCVRVN